LSPPLLIRTRSPLVFLSSLYRMPFYAPSAYYPLPGAPQPQQQSQQFNAPAAPVDQAQAQLQAQQLAYQQQQQQQQQQQLQQQQQQQFYQQQQLQQQQYAAQQQRLQQQQFAQQQQQYQQPATPSRQQQRSGYQAATQQSSPAAPLYKSSEYVPSGGVYSTGGAYNQPTLRRAPSRADVNTAVENQEVPFQSFGAGLNSEQQRGLVSQYNPYANYGQAVTQSPIRPQRGASQREPSEYAFDGLNPAYKQQQQYSQGIPSEMGARTLNAPQTVVLDGNNNSLPPRSPARVYQRGQGGAVESAYIGLPNDLQYAQNNQQRAYNQYAQESRPAYVSSSRTNQSANPKLKPAAARELYAALSSEDVRTALERDAPLLQQIPAYSTYNGQRVQGRAFVVPADQKYSEYNLDDLNGLRSVIDAPLR
ncbi:hypothetical protein PMAYCL1PPCAC_12636, partial [Pristionchus mayeri]